MRAELYRDDTGAWRWRLVHTSNGRILADGGQGYTRRDDAIHGLSLVTGARVEPLASTGQECLMRYELNTAPESSFPRQELIVIELS